jgi:hypothetical protein
MVLGSLISLTFWPTLPAGGVWPIAENVNYPNHIREPDGRVFHCRPPSLPKAHLSRPSSPLAGQSR